MRVALLTTFQASRKDPLAGVLERIHAAFLAGVGAPAVRFILADAPLPGFVSSVDRVLKRYPQLARFVAESAMFPGGPVLRHIGNESTGEQVEFSTLLAIASGVPRSFPFHSISIHFQSPAFGDVPEQSAVVAAVTPGVVVGDSWWVNGRSRSVMAYSIVEGDASSKKLPAPPEAVAAVLAACGKAKSTVQLPFLAGAEAGVARATPNPEAARKVDEVIRDYRARFSWIVEHSAMPHDLPPALEAMQSGGLGQTTGPKKPVLERAFGPMGYDCKGGSGTFTLRRRTPGNLTVSVELDVGTWSRSLTAMFEVHGLGFRGVFRLPVSKRAGAVVQYPIGDGEQWQKLVENLAVLVGELDRSFVMDLEKAAGASPEWYSPES